MFKNTSKINRITRFMSLPVSDRGKNVTNYYFPFHLLLPIWERRRIGKSRDTKQYGTESSPLNFYFIPPLSKFSDSNILCNFILIHLFC